MRGDQQRQCKHPCNVNDSQPPALLGDSFGEKSRDGGDAHGDKQPKQSREIVCIKLIGQQIARLVQFGTAATEYVYKKGVVQPNIGKEEDEKQ